MQSVIKIVRIPTYHNMINDLNRYNHTGEKWGYEGM